MSCFSFIRHLKLDLDTLKETEKGVIAIIEDRTVRERQEREQLVERRETLQVLFFFSQFLFLTSFLE